MKITNIKVVTKNTLRAFFSITLDSGLVIHNCSLYQKGESRWIGLPAEKYAKKDGTTGYLKLVDFTSHQISGNFRRQVLLALEEQGVHKCEGPSRPRRQSDNFAEPGGARE